MENFWSKIPMAATGRCSWAYAAGSGLHEWERQTLAKSYLSGDPNGPKVVKEPSRFVIQTHPAFVQILN